MDWEVAICSACRCSSFVGATFKGAKSKLVTKSIAEIALDDRHSSKNLQNGLSLTHFFVRRIMTQIGDCRTPRLPKVAEIEVQEVHVSRAV